MGAAREATLEGGGRTNSLVKVLPCGSSGGSLVWVGDISAHGDNESEDLGSACEFFNQVTRKQATQQRDRSWRNVIAEEVLQGVGK